MKRPYVNAAIALLLLVAPAIAPLAPFEGAAFAQNNQRVSKVGVAAYHIDYRFKGKTKVIDLPKQVMVIIMSYSKGQDFVSDELSCVKFSGPLAFTFEFEGQEHYFEADEAIFTLYSKRIEDDRRKAGKQ